MFFTYHPKLVERMVKETPKTIAGLVVLSVIFVLIYKDHVPNGLLVVWGILQSIFIYLRHLNAKTLGTYIEEGNSEKIRLHVKYFFGLMIYSAFVWNSGAIVGAVYGSSPYEYISFVLIMGLITAGALSLSSILSGYTLYFLLMLLPQLFLFSQYPDSAHHAIILLAIIYIPSILILAKSINRNLVKHIEDNESLAKSVEELHTLSITDGLTEVYNRRHFFETVEHMIELSKRERTAVSLLMLDIDHFKTLNDTYGHQAGDMVLVALAKEIQGMTRSSDIFARIGGEEFALFLYGVSVDEAKQVAQNICTTVEEHAFTYRDKRLDVTVSIGVAEIGKEVNTLDELHHEADKKLYDAKGCGRNCIC